MSCCGSLSPRSSRPRVRRKNRLPGSRTYNALPGVRPLDSAQPVAIRCISVHTLATGWPRPKPASRTSILQADMESSNLLPLCYRMPPNSAELAGRRLEKSPKESHTYVRRFRLGSCENWLLSLCSAASGRRAALGSPRFRVCGASARTDLAPGQWQSITPRPWEQVTKVRGRDCRMNVFGAHSGRL